VEILEGRIGGSIEKEKGPIYLALLQARGVKGLAGNIL